jgi:hypothetical protein
MRKQKGGLENATAPCSDQPGCHAKLAPADLVLSHEPPTSASSHKITQPSMGLPSMKQPTVSASSTSSRTWPLKYTQLRSTTHRDSASFPQLAIFASTYQGAYRNHNNHQLFDNPAAQSFPGVTSSRKSPRHFISGLNLKMRSSRKAYL